MQSDSTPSNSKKENVFLGIVGAIIGSLAGVLAIILLDRLGFVASVSGVLMAICTMMLYEKFAKGMSTTGIIICVIIMIGMTLLAENIAFSISCADALNELGVPASFGDVFGNLYQLMSDGVIKTDAYVTSLVMVYLFTAVGAAGVIARQRGAAKNVPVKNTPAK